MKITSKIFLNPVILFALLLVPGLVGAASTCNHTRVDGVSGTSITYYTLYKGGVSGLEDIDCGETPIEVTLEGSASNRLICFDPNPGFEISNWAKEFDVKKVCTDIHTEISPNIEWKGDGETYTVPFDYTPNSDIGSASPISCTGGLEYNTVCSVNFNYRDQYVVETCPLSKYICPGHSQNLASYEQYPVNTFPKVVFKEVIPGEVTVYGDDLIGGENEQTTQMTVPYPTEGQNNAEIYWETQDVTVCKCTTSTGVDCTPLVGTTYSTFPKQKIKAKDSPYSLTSGKTFLVECW